MTISGNLAPIDTLPGVQPATDATEAFTPHYTNSDKIRFNGGMPEKIGGFESIDFDYSDTVLGTIRSYFSEVINGKYYNVLGTDKRLYAVIGSRLTNITPFVTTATAAADSLSTQYDTLGSNPFSATLDSPIVTVTDSDASRFKVGDTVYFSGATGFAGIAAGALNGDAIVRSIGSGTYTINVGTNATSTTTGGGASVVRTSGLINVASTAHGLTDGARINMDNAGDTGGILAAEINVEAIIRNVATNNFDIMTTGEATSSVTASGGSSTEYYEPIPVGDLDEGVVTGYGAGLYGIGLYGTALQSTLARSYPRIWFMDRYGSTVIATPGNQSGVYQWDGTTSTAPELVANAPTAVNYAFISNNILVTFGAPDGATPKENRIFASDLGDITNWTSSSINQVYDDDIEGAGRLTSHVPVEGKNLIFTEHRTFTFRYIGLPAVWEILTLDETVGIIAPMARVSVKGMAFWMGLENFYMYRGGSVEVIPSNSGPECTALRYVFDDLNWGQKSKCFAWYNKRFNEVWFHYPSANSNECDRVAVVNILDFSWAIHTFDRTAAEYPNVKLKNPRLANVGTLYQHEYGKNADGQPLSFTLSTNKRYYGNKTANVLAIIPDSVQDDNLTFKAEGFLYPQSPTQMYINNQTITPTTERIPIATNGRFYKYTWSGSALGQDWIMGRWFEEVQRGSSE